MSKREEAGVERLSATSRSWALAVLLSTWRLLRLPDLYPPTPRYLNAVKAGDKVEMKGPFSKFVYKANDWDAIGMVAAGTGITPMYQVLLEILGNPRDKTEVRLVYASRSDIILKDELDALQAVYPNFKVRGGVGSEATLSASLRGAKRPLERFVPLGALRSPWRASFPLARFTSCANTFPTLSGPLHPLKTRRNMDRTQRPCLRRPPFFLPPPSPTWRKGQSHGLRPLWLHEGSLWREKVAFRSRRARRPAQGHAFFT